MKKIESYGSWKTPITADLVSSGTTGLGEISINGDVVYWLETRPSEDGRTVLVKLTPEGEKVDVTPFEFNTRSRVHEYGGAPYLIFDDKVYFTNYEDQRVYEIARGEEPKPLTPESGYRYADFSVEEESGDIWAVCEDHSGKEEPENYLVSLSLNGSPEIGRAHV